MPPFTPALPRPMRSSLFPVSRPALVLAVGLLATAGNSFAGVTAGSTAATFGLDRVRLLDGPFKHAQELNRQYLLKHDIDRLVAPFRIEAGLPSPKPKYPNWESSGLDGHTAGHYLTALAQEWAATRDVECKRRLDAMVAGLAECQQAGSDGYVGGIPRGRTLWNDVAAGRINFQNFSLNGAWVPWYNEHKLFAGLRDAWLLAGSVPARDVLVRLADWCDTLLAGLTDEQMQAMLGSEHGGMNEVLADVHAITGEPKYLRLAQRFSHRAILNPLLRHEDRLTGLHANTQIPKVIGFARIAELGGDASWRDASRYFWETVSGRRSVAFGGNSEREHFNPADDFSALLESREGPETCNTYNMLRLTEALFRAEPAARYADYYERGLYNHILASQHPGHGGFVYFTPIRPRHYRVYSQPEVCFWCCVGSGMENHGKYGAFIYARSRADAVLYVNLFIASELDWQERGIRVRQETTFPDEARTRLVISAVKPQRFALRIRHPGWCERPEVSINGAVHPVSSAAASYLEIEREWREGDRVEVVLPMRTTLERLPDGSDYAAVLHGPIVLAAKTGTEQLDGLVANDGRMAHVAPGAYLPLDRAPMLVGDGTNLADGIRPVAGQALTFTARALIQPEAFQHLELVPFFRVHDSRYMIYWRTVATEKYPEVVAALEDSERARLALEARTLDHVAPGEQQSEVEHGFAGEATRTGSNQGRRSREAQGGWFSYRLNAGGTAAPLELIVTYDGGERDRAFDLVVNDQVIATIERKGGQRDRFIDAAYAVPAELARAGTLTVKFASRDKSRTASVYGVRLVRVEK
jgi:DUF1680 family protein